MTYILFFAVFLSFLLYLWVSVRMEVVSSEENIKKLYKNIVRKRIEVRNILSQIRNLLSEHINAESRVIVEALTSQNPNYHMRTDSNLILVQLHNLRSYLLPELGFNQVFNNYYNEIVRLESEITALTAEKDNAVKNYNIRMKNPVVNLFGYNDSNKIDFHTIESIEREVTGDIAQNSRIRDLINDLYN